ncbi:MAG: DUF5678 domain-containing protein [Methanosarcinales archaeon]|nr:hypothetical protein [Methanosarcinales archaeon]
MKKIPKRFWEDVEWVRKYCSELTAKYPDQWVAIFNKQVIAADEDLGKVEDIAKAKIHEEPIHVIFLDSGLYVY